MARRRRGTNTGIPGLTFSWKRALGISRARYRFARRTGIPTTRSGLYRKVGRGCLPVALIGLVAVIGFVLLRAHTKRG